MNVFQTAFHLAHFIFPSGGTCLEFGVFRGGTYCYQAEHLLQRYRSSRLIGFDSWRGLPAEANGVWAPTRHEQGGYAAPKDEVIGKLRRLGVTPEDPRFRLVDGYFSESLTGELRRTIDELAFINIDVDIYKSTIELLEFVRPILRPGVILYWDDWKDPNDEHSADWGEHLAWEHWVRDQPGLEVETLEVNAVNQRSMIVTEVDGRRLTSPSMAEIRYHALALSARYPDFDESDLDLFLGLAKRQLGKVPVAGSLARSLKRRMSASR